MLEIGSGINVDDPVVISAFDSALLRQGIIALLIFVLVWLAWVTGRGRLPGVTQAGDPAGSAGAAGSAAAEPAWRKLLRVGFGLLWVFDGILQAQPRMVLGLPSQVVGPVAGSSPHWVQQVVTWAGTTWSHHPVQAAA